MSKVYAPKTVQEAWDNHFSAFGAKDVPKILLDYDENSVIRVWVDGADKVQEHKGVQAVEAFFTALFKDLSDYKTLKAPLITVDETAKMVFLVWECKGCGYELGTDTFLFDDKFKILRQNIVVKKAAVEKK
mmetsp:Transcript_22521/g.42325  ORF Transcript_22521/g.42325 Transcript_22521/m.42325 type:complete len:131 (-) Transcript_22521:195-587(-)|eukprot:CAMPEP_0170168672 /NCGR_PEP_ID=MMETSP0040_2-20121228/1621_1 /TAXON_ID=641309 /ORGANISM="Lotharella oceanica, Strain CCMP622" /LENGTH=130 /DNA_ID=CAMNT_0010406969 /DNA_START=44 /DNA_END=436 /DNA_ORIENTATION=-